MSSKQKAFQGPDAYQRMNFLYQASQLTAGKNDVLSSYYGGLVKSIGKKVVLRIDPAMKRQLCKRCNLFLIVDSTCDMHAEQTKSKQEQLCLTCKKCGFTKKYLINPKYKLEDPRSNVAPQSLIVTKKGKNCIKPKNKATISEDVKKKSNDSKNKMKT